MPLEIGSTAPQFSLPNQHREAVSLDDLAGAPAVLVFIPFAFTSTCEGELCEIRDHGGAFNHGGARVVAITCNTLHANRAWSESQGFEFDILSDFWPHGDVSREYQTFNELGGYAERTTYFLDRQGTITKVLASAHIGEARPFDEYLAALA